MTRGYYVIDLNCREECDYKLVLKLTFTVHRLLDKLKLDKWLCFLNMNNYGIRCFRNILGLYNSKYENNSEIWKYNWLNNEFNFRSNYRF